MIFFFRPCFFKLTGQMDITKTYSTAQHPKLRTASTYQTLGDLALSALFGKCGQDRVGKSAPKLCPRAFAFQPALGVLENAPNRRENMLSVVAPASCSSSMSTLYTTV